MDIKTAVGRLRMMGWLEAVSWLALLITMYLKYGLQMPEPNKIVGMVHGLFFMGYCLLALQAKLEHQWKFGMLAKLILAGILPFGTLVAEAKLLKKA